MSTGTEDRGETLIELIVTIVILGLVGVAIVGSLGAAIMVSQTHREQTTAAGTVRDYAEAIENAVVTTGYQASCSPAYAPAFAVPAGFSAPHITAVSFWNGSGFPGTCSATTDRGVQQLTLQVSSTDGRATENLVIVVRNPCGPGTACG